MSADNDLLSQQPEDEICLPRAAVNKMIKELLPHIRVSNDARELVLNCCTEFIHLIASEANDICSRQARKTISPEHIIEALSSLGFNDYVKDVSEVHEQFKTQEQTRKKKNKLKNHGISDEELLRQQQQIFAEARLQQEQEWYQLQCQQAALQSGITADGSSIASTTATLTSPPLIAPSVHLPQIQTQAALQSCITAEESSIASTTATLTSPLIAPSLHLPQTQTQAALQSCIMADESSIASTTAMITSPLIAPYVHLPQIQTQAALQSCITTDKRSIASTTATLTSPLIAPSVHLPQTQTQVMPSISGTYTGD